MDDDLSQHALLIGNCPPNVGCDTRDRNREALSAQLKRSSPELRGDPS
jgi:hypothetical protein